MLLHGYSSRLRPFGSYPLGVQAAILLVLSVVFVLILEAARLPAALLLGPMAAAILLSALEGTVRVPLVLFFLAQGVIGCMIVRVIPLSIVNEIARDWPLFLAGVFSVIIAATVLGWLLMRWGALPGTTAIWGSSPGAATPMILMAEAYGGDFRLVAFMQYLRVVCVAIAASVVSRLWITGSGSPPPPIVWFSPIAWVPFIETCALAGIGAIAGWLLRVPAGPLLVPLAVGVVLQDTGTITIELPQWLLAASYALVGWTIGLRFTRAILVHAARVFPRVVLSTLTLIAICALIAAVLVFAAGIDPLTAYLATSPGGADSVAIIAASTNVNVPFIMAMQTARLLIVIITGPALARFVIKRMGFSDAPR